MRTALATLTGNLYLVFGTLFWAIIAIVAGLVPPRGHVEVEVYEIGQGTRRIEYASLTPAQLDGLLVREIDRYKKAAQVAGIPPQ